MPSVTNSGIITSTAQIANKVIETADIADSAVDTLQIAANAITDAKVGAHTTTKITSPFSLVTGTVPVNQGGTGQITQTAAFDALDPLTTQGDIAYHNGTNTVRLGTGTNGQALISGGAGANLSWGTPAGTPNWVLEGAVAWAAETTDKSITITNTGKDLYFLVVSITSRSSAAFSMRFDANATATGYNYVTEAAGVNTATGSQAQIVIGVAGTRTLFGGGYISVNTAGTGPEFVGHIGSGALGGLVSGFYTPGDMGVMNSVDFLVNGATITGQIALYSLNF